MSEAICVCLYLFCFTSTCVEACGISVLGCTLLFYMCEYWKKKCFHFCVYACVNSPSSTSVQCRNLLMHSMFLSREAVCVCASVCVLEREWESGSILLTCLPWCRAYRPALRFTTWNIKTRLLVILWSFSLLIGRPALGHLTYTARDLEGVRGGGRKKGVKEREGERDPESNPLDLKPSGFAHVSTLASRPDVVTQPYRAAGHCGPSVSATLTPLHPQALLCSRLPPTPLSPFLILLHTTRTEFL